MKKVDKKKKQEDTFEQMVDEIKDKEQIKFSKDFMTDFVEPEIPVKVTTLEPNKMPRAKLSIVEGMPNLLVDLEEGVFFSIEFNHYSGKNYLSQLNLPVYYEDFTKE